MQQLVLLVSSESELKGVIMASTTQTTNYGLPIYEQSDKASWVDTNEPFNEIDTALKGAVTDVESLTPVVAQNTSNIATLQENVTSQSARITTLEDVTIPGIQENVTSLQGTVATHTTKISELESEIENLQPYKIIASIKGNGTLTYTQALHTFYDTLSNLSEDELYRVHLLWENKGSTSSSHYNMMLTFFALKTSASNEYYFTRISTGTTEIANEEFAVLDTNSHYTRCQVNSSGFSTVNNSNNVVASTGTFILALE